MQFVTSYLKFMAQYNHSLIPGTTFIVDHFRGENLQYRPMLLIPIYAYFLPKKLTINDQRFSSLQSIKTDFSPRILGIDL
jgi:hypothetical protein